MDIPDVSRRDIIALSGLRPTAPALEEGRAADALLARRHRRGVLLTGLLR